MREREIHDRPNENENKILFRCIYDDDGSETENINTTHDNRYRSSINNYVNGETSIDSGTLERGGWREAGRGRGGRAQIVKESVCVYVLKFVQVSV